MSNLQAFAACGQAFQGAKMMVERPILLHQDDNVLDISNAARVIVCWDLDGLGDIRLQRPGRRAHSEQLQKFTPIGILHDDNSLRGPHEPG